MNTQRRVSKSRFLTGLTCARRAYLEAHSPELARKPSIADQERMRTGQEIGMLARCLYDGVLIGQPSTDMKRASGDTEREIDAGARVLFEAAFETSQAEARVDVLEKLDTGGWHIIEVKSSKTVSKDHLVDVAFQMHVLTECGLNVEKCSLLVISGDYIYDGTKIDPGKFFVLQDVTADVVALQTEIQESVSSHVRTLEGDFAPNVVPNVHCKRNGECPFLRHCWHDMPRHDVTTLPLINASVVHELHDIGVRDIADIPTTTKLSARQRLIADVVRTGVPFVSDSLSEALSSLRYPLHFVDFECTSSAIPTYSGVAPYRHVPFQWSIHVLEQPDQSSKHLEFLHRDASDPRKPFADALWQAVSTAGTVLFYSSYEKTILKALAADGVASAENARVAFVERGIDLEKIVKENVYLPEFYGKTSIKRVYPALVPSAGFSGLAIQDGETAAAEFRRMLSSATTPIESRKIASDLLLYCERDTQAMLDVFLALQKMVDMTSDLKQRAPH